jgi:pyrrolysyl-tRNA synthetase-like protein
MSLTTGARMNDEIRLTLTQEQRLRELGADPLELEHAFGTVAERDASFKRVEDDLARAGRQRLQDLRARRRAPQLIELELELRRALIDAGFVQVVTPVIIGSDALEKMGIEHGHALRQQVFWLEDGRCLRPMLAPNLYTLLRRLGRHWSRPFGIFEIGPCFRRDSKGSRHLNEFTMLNLVELGLPQEQSGERLEALADLVVKAAGLREYRIARTVSEVYGPMLDIEIDGAEVCSAAAGPHPLDANWGILEPWVGLGFGLERLIMAREGFTGIERAGRSLMYVDGVRLNI